MREYDAGAQSSKPDAQPEEAAWQKAYYEEVLLPDEKRIFVSAALEHMKIVEGATGMIIVVVQDGKGVIDLPDEIMNVWKEYVARGKK